MTRLDPLKVSCLVYILSAPMLLAQRMPLAPTIDQRLQMQVGRDRDTWTPAQLTNISRLRDAALNDDYAYLRLRHITNNIGPRLAGSPQAEQAVNYVAAQMRALGATVTLEKTRVPHWVRGVETGALVKWKDMTPHTEQKIVLTAFGGSVPTPQEGITAPIILVSSIAQLRQLQPNAFRGKIVLLNGRFDKQMAAQGEGYQAALQVAAFRMAAPQIAKAGAAAILVRSISGADYRIPHTGSSFSPDNVPKVPIAAVTSEDAELIADLVSQGDVQMRLVLTPEVKSDVESYNVIADWKGNTHPEQVVLVSGHLDSWDLGTGALDDGAGIVISMETIELLHKLDLHPQRTIRFVAWMNEESGSTGAETYIQEHAHELANHVGAIENDFGADHAVGLEVDGKPAFLQWLQPVSEQLELIGAGNISSSDDPGYDIAGLVSRGVPGIKADQDSRFYLNYHHTAADTLDKIDPIALRQNAAVTAVTAYSLADSDSPIPR